MTRFGVAASFGVVVGEASAPCYHRQSLGKARAKTLLDGGIAMRFACLGFLMLWSTASMAEVPALCADAPNQTEATLCAKRKLDSAEAGLAKARDALHAKLDRIGQRNLDIAQEAWRRFRDFECNLETGYDAEHPDENGTIMPLLIGECAKALTERRTRDLTDQLACPGGDLSCER